ncbi:MAG TPA: trypsin-like peptidase domain-containing protein [Verrucomicrobiae bacterium]|nr:trypsin-like peptidase domain-containing protein [Verrucomicrobiae bacterium]
MKLKRQLLLLGVIGLCGTFTGFSQEDDIRRDATVKVVEEVMPCVADILTKSIVPVRNPFERMQRQIWGGRQFDEYISAGSGVVIDEDGYLLTNEHMIHGAEQIAVRFGTGTNEYEATVLASDPKIDVALLQLKGKPGETFHAIKFAPEDDLLLGETVLALGNPLGLGGTVTRGILSSKSRATLREGEQTTYRNLLQIDAPINHGNSGGPLVDLKGELIGINAQVVNQDVNGEPVQGIGFAIPIRLVEEALSDIPTEFVKSYWFGARVKVGTYPLVIASVQAESPADRAGLKVGDIVLQVNGKVPRNFIKFGALLASNAPAVTPLTIRRGENESDINVRLIPVSEVFNAKMVQDKLGLTFQDNSSGFLITDVETNSPAATAGLQAGMTVQAIDYQDLPKDIIELAKMLYAKKRGEPVQLYISFMQKVGNFNVSRQGWVPLRPR